MWYSESTPVLNPELVLLGTFDPEEAEAIIQNLTYWRQAPSQSKTSLVDLYVCPMESSHLIEQFLFDR